MKKGFYVFLLLLAFSCDKVEKHEHTFYYWRSELKLNPVEKEALKKATVPFLYARFFDVDKVNGRFEPVAVITKDQSFVTRKKIVPVIFIVNQTFYGINKEEISFLADRIFKLIEKKVAEYHLTVADEIQIDCDWTEGTRDDYFRFLKTLGKISGRKITSTLRLHQVKDKLKMGIPPVEKVYLMCYSTSNPLLDSDKNSILDVQILKNYLDDLEDYPIKKIDVALPIFSWAVVTNIFDKHKLISGVGLEDLKNPHFKLLSANEAEVEKDGFYFGFYLNRGFHIKVEQVSNEQLHEVIRFLDKKLDSYALIYFQLSSKFVKYKGL